MSFFYRTAQGVEHPIAGMTPSGSLVPSATYVQSGTVTVTNMGDETANKHQDYTVALSPSMPDTNYVVYIENDNMFDATVQPASKTAASFIIRVKNFKFTNGSSTCNLKWIAFRPITNEDRELDEQAIADLQAVVPSDASSNNKLTTASNITSRGIIESVAFTTSTSSAVWEEVLGGTYMAIQLTSTWSSYGVGTLHVWKNGTTDTIKAQFIDYNGRATDLTFTDGISSTFASFYNIKYENSTLYVGRATADSTTRQNHVYVYRLQTPVLTSTVTSGSTAPITSGGVYSEFGKHGRTSIIQNGTSFSYNVGENSGGIVIAHVSDGQKQVRTFSVGWNGLLVSEDIISGNNLFSLSYSSGTLTITGTSSTCIVTVMSY